VKTNGTARAGDPDAAIAISIAPPSKSCFILALPAETKTPPILRPERTME